MDYISAPRVPQMNTSVKVGDVIEIKRVITVVEIDNEKKQIKMKWKDKLGKEKVQWITYKMFLML
jgi:uncharacterized protein YigE (DUF2233 family)